MNGFKDFAHEKVNSVSLLSFDGSGWTRLDLGGLIIGTIEEAFAEISKHYDALCESESDLDETIAHYAFTYTTDVEAFRIRVFADGSYE